MPPDYATDTEPKALQILDDVSLAQVVKYYGKTPGYDAKSQLFRDLGIPADYFGSLLTSKRFWVSTLGRSG